MSEQPRCECPAKHFEQHDGKCHNPAARVPEGVVTDPPLCLPCLYECMP